MEGGGEEKKGEGMVIEAEELEGREGRLGCGKKGNG